MLVTRYYITENPELLDPEIKISYARHESPRLICSLFSDSHSMNTVFVILHVAMLCMYVPPRNPPSRQVGL